MRFLSITLLVLISGLCGFNTNKVAAQNQIGGHFGVVQPIVTFQTDQTVTGFDPHVLGFPIGITVRKSEKFAFDAEFVPFVTFEANEVALEDGTTQRKDKVTLLVHPGFLWGLGRKFTFGTRLAYELGDEGRYGFTPLLNKGFAINNTPVFVELVAPVRMGSDKEADVSLGLHVGFGF